MQLDFVMLKTRDLDRARNFYEDLLGREPSEVEENRMVYFEFEGVTLGLFNPEADYDEPDRIEFGDNVIPGFSSDNFSELKGRVEEIAESGLRDTPPATTGSPSRTRKGI